LRVEKPVKGKGNEIHNISGKAYTEPTVNKVLRPLMQTRHRGSMAVSNSASKKHRNIDSPLSRREEVDVLIKLRQVARNAFVLQINQTKNCNAQYKYR
jgi:hypothetical protein